MFFKNNILRIILINRIISGKKIAKSKELNNIIDFQIFDKYKTTIIHKLYKPH